MSLSFQLVQLIGVKFVLFDIVQYFCFKPAILYEIQKTLVITTDFKAKAERMCKMEENQLSNFLKFQLYLLQKYLKIA